MKNISSILLFLFLLFCISCVSYPVKDGMIVHDLTTKNKIDGSINISVKGGVDKNSFINYYEITNDEFYGAVKDSLIQPSIIKEIDKNNQSEWRLEVQIIGQYLFKKEFLIFTIPFQDWFYWIKVRYKLQRENTIIIDEVIETHYKSENDFISTATGERAREASENAANENIRKFLVALDEKLSLQ